HLVLDGSELQAGLVPWRQDCYLNCTLAHYRTFDYCMENPCGDINSVQASRANWCPGTLTPAIIWEPMLSPGKHQLTYAIDGIAVIVAAFVTLCLGARDVEEYLSKFAARVFTEDEYLRQLKQEKLLEVRRRITTVVADTIVENKAKYKFDPLHEAFENQLFGKLMPRKGANDRSGEYRTKYRELI